MSKSKIPEMLKDANDRAEALANEIDDLARRAHLTPEQQERLERQVSAGERLHGEIDALKVTNEELLREAVANGWVVGGSDEGPAFIPDRQAWADPNSSARSTKNELEYQMRALDSAPDVDRDRIEKLVRSEDGKNDAEFVIVRV